MNKPFFIREAREEDSYIIATIQVEAWRKAYISFIPYNVLLQVSIQEREVRWKQHLNDGVTKTFVLVTESVVKGFIRVSSSIDYEKGERVGEVIQIYVSPSKQGSGFGQVLLENAFIYLRGAGFKYVILWVAQANFNACRFYQKMGFCNDESEKVEVMQGVPFKEIRLKRYLL